MGSTPLHNAAQNGKSRAVEILLSFGADPTIPGKYIKDFKFNKNKTILGTDHTMLHLIVVTNPCPNSYNCT